MLPKIKINFYLAGDDVDLGDLSEKLNLQPTRVRKKNEWPQASILAGIAQDVWELQMEKEECKAVSIQLDKLQKRLISKVEIIKELSSQYRLESSVTVVIEMEAGGGPEMVLSKENIVFLSLLNAEIGFDLYID